MNAELLATLIGILAVIAFWVMVAGLFKPSWVIRRPSLQTRKGVFFVWGLAWLCLVILSVIITQSATPNETVSESAVAQHKLYVKVERANLRKCPLPTCDVIDTFMQNSWVTTPANSLAEAPEWIEVSYDADPAPGDQLATGYINKVTLAEEPVSASGSAAGQPPSGGGGSTSSGGITIGPWANIQTTVGEYYETPFCEPSSAISGATCGALADTTTDPRGGKPPYSFIKKSGFLPPGMVLELNGTLRGSPTQEGTYKFRLCAKDLYGGEGCQDLAVMVKKDTSLYADPAPASGNVSVDSIICKVIGREEVEGGEPYTIYYFEILFSGTATGPVRSILSVYSNQVGMFDDFSKPNTYYYGDKKDYLTASSWTERMEEEGGRLIRIVRKEGDPSTTKWESGGFLINGQKINGGFPFGVQMVVSLHTKEYGYLLASERPIVLCSD